MKKIYIYILLFISFYSCYSVENKEFRNIVNKWSNREILFPDSLHMISNHKVIGIKKREAEYTIISYVDSTGCTPCKLHLSKWKNFIDEMHYALADSIPLLLVVNDGSFETVDYISTWDKFSYPIYVDISDSINQLNNFPTDDRFQTFLLDKNNKVVAIGNPIHNPKVKELYMKIILGDKAPKKKDEIKTMAEMGTSFIDFGEFDWKVEQKATFKLKNTGAQPLVILDVTTSCGCISADFPKEPVAAGKEAEIAVVYKADKPEHFNKTVTVYCNAGNAPFTVKVTGTAK